MSNARHAPFVPSVGHPFVVGILQVDLRLPGCRSLKEKRGRLARVMTALRKACPVVVAEVGDQDVWGRAALAAASLSTDRDLATRVLEAAAELLTRQPEVELLYHQIELA
jgi:uncharacterized protein YlxP (DUF503 family)